MRKSWLKHILFFKNKYYASYSKNSVVSKIRTFHNIAFYHSIAYNEQF